MHTTDARSTRELLAALDDLRSRAALTALAGDGLAATAVRHADVALETAAGRVHDALDLVDAQLGGLAELLEHQLTSRIDEDPTSAPRTAADRRYTYLGTGRRAAPV